MVYIAHFDDKDYTRIESVKEHLLNTEKLCVNYAGKDFKSLARMSALLHDLGKYSTAFQTYISYKQKSIQKPTYDNRKVIHSTAGMQLIMENYHNTDNKMQKLTAEILGEIICSHHGGLVDMGKDLRPVLQMKIDNYPIEEYEEAVNIFYIEILNKKELDELFDACCSEISSYSTKIRSTSMNKYGKSYWYFMVHMLIKYIYSCLIDADRTDTYNFVTNNKSIEDKFIPWNIYENNLNISINKYSNQDLSKSEQIISELRKNVSEQCFNMSHEKRGIYRLSVPTGGGKTLSSIRFALAHRKKHNMSRIIYVIPYTSIIEQNAQEIRTKLGCSDDLFEHHSNVVDCNNDDNEMSKKELLTCKWDSAIIFTTMVQFLNTFFNGNTQNMRRMHNLYNSIIIFDEIQTVPGNCISLFNSTITFLANICNCTIVLCSATQIKLENAPHNLPTPIQLINNTQYLFEKFKRMEVVDNRNPAMSYYDASEFIKSKKASTKSILCITNTKVAAFEIFNNLQAYSKENSIELYYLSTYLCPAHRKDVIAEVKNKLRNGKQLICISTQLIEAGVDISFETVIRSEAGLDSIAQASGRGNRNGEKCIGYTYIIKLKEEKSSLIKDIQWGQTCTETALTFYNLHQEDYGDILSEKTIGKYYDEFFNKQSDYYRSMNYRIPNSENMYDMLSNKCSSILQKKYILGYPFKTAADNFNVIDKNTKAVLVPYKDGAEIICKLGSNETELSEKYELLKKSQLYCVQLWPYEYEQIKNGIYFYEEVGIYVLRNDYYDCKNTGLLKHSSPIFCEY